MSKFTTPIAYSDIFNSSGHPLRQDTRTGIAQLAKCLEEGVISIFLNELGGTPLFDKVRSLTSDPLNFKDNLQEIMPLLRGYFYEAGGQFHHKVLVLLATALLIDHGYQVELERWRNGKKVDVVSTDNHWIIECGDTSPEPVIDHLYHSCDKFGVLPYQELESGSIEMFVFERGQNWSEQRVLKELYPAIYKGTSPKSATGA